MVNEKFLKVLVVVLALVAAAAWLRGGQKSVEAGHTFVDKHCASVNMTCRWAYSSDGFNLIASQANFHLLHWRSAAVWHEVTDEPVMDWAENVWAKAEGPQVLVEPYPDKPPYYPTTDNFLKSCGFDSGAPPDCSDPNVVAIVCNYRVSGGGGCASPVITTNIFYSEIWLNDLWYDDPNIGQRRGARNHEIGHTLGLRHHWSHQDRKMIYACRPQRSLLA